MEEYIGVIKMFGGSYPPQYYMDCDGTVLQIQANQALFSVLGTTYGGDGRTSFGLPDLRARDANGQPIPFNVKGPRWIICVQGIYPSREQ
ncbi:phage tail protein [Paracraurococcus ruber]|uniref:Phage tail protein n=1 Tax=Paracraurococcus ruber TaxID=77675 RepID=A0ABS1CTV2_9PROT|nr:tail fiber protein [Paracraurococcus ruber]MBK1657422.1 phage tail protein [Paracraurococcus ruber]TDG33853.1 phage tail protein [Paracraurococcus ruber]